VRRLKLYLAVLGFTLAGAGVGLDNRALVWAAISVLAVALALRWWGRRRESRSDTGAGPPTRA
jgi:Zn-dependent protease with chaperone function